MLQNFMPLKRNHFLKILLKIYLSWKCNYSFLIAIIYKQQKNQTNITKLQFNIILMQMIKKPNIFKKNYLIYQIIRSHYKQLRRNKELNLYRILMIQIIQLSSNYKNLIRKPKPLLRVQYQMVNRNQQKVKHQSDKIQGNNNQIQKIVYLKEVKVVKENDQITQLLLNQTLLESIICKKDCIYQYLLIIYEIKIKQLFQMINHNLFSSQSTISSFKNKISSYFQIQCHIFFNIIVVLSSALDCQCKSIDKNTSTILSQPPINIRQGVVSFEYFFQTLSIQSIIVLQLPGINFPLYCNGSGILEIEVCFTMFQFPLDINLNKGKNLPINLTIFTNHGEFAGFILRAGAKKMIPSYEYLFFKHNSNPIAPPILKPAKNIFFG